MKNQGRCNWPKAVLLVLSAVGLAGLPLAAGEEGHHFSGDFATDWKLQMEYTIEVAEAMPAENYGFKPSEEMRPFGELMTHIGGANYFFSALARGAEPPAEAKFEGEATKERVLSFLKGSFEYAEEAIASLDDDKAMEEITIFGGQFTMSRAKLCEFMRNHVTHHRGYALPYLRMNGVAPPSYRFSQRNTSPM
jgi:uncharacterized damage-inducible protein DinB